MRNRGVARDLCGRKPNWLGCNNASIALHEALLKHCGINFIDRVCQRNRAIGGRVSAILVATLKIITTSASFQ